MNFGIEKQFKIVILISCLFIPSVRNKVSPDFKSCRQMFFLNGQIPKGFPKDDNKDIINICQRYKNNYHFATLYSAKHRIPFYSAYSIGQSTRKENCTRPELKEWFIEPQVSDKTSTDNEMKPANKEYKKYQANQTVDSDMRNNGKYDRGHLSPCSYHFTQDAREATFTFTNMVPQFRKFNSGPWSKAKQNTLKITKDHCKKNRTSYFSYFITGAIPSKYNLLNGRVNIPTEMWTAVCCEGKDKDDSYSYGYYRANNDSPEKVMLTDLSSLQTHLKKLYAFNIGPITLFDGQCSKTKQNVPDFVKTIFQSARNK